MLTPAHIGKERYARTRMPGTPQGHHRHGRATWYEGTNEGEQKDQQGKAQHKKKKKKKKKKRPCMLHAMLRYATDTRREQQPRQKK